MVTVSAYDVSEIAGELSIIEDLFAVYCEFIDREEEFIREYKDEGAADFFMSQPRRDMRCSLRSQIAMNISNAAKALDKLTDDAYKANKEKARQ